MRLQTLRLHGFKSFADRTTLDFREGVTAIVGSNGCGKSNIADAIRWVLGEQRASAIRGSKMEEAIFQGTARRRPLNFAEVSLLFDNESGRVPVPQTELEITRKVFREGGSEYSLNRAACRLRDVQSLLRDTGLGSNAYAIIEGAMIEAILSDRADERRGLFEEAAGIGKYKDSRQAAERRLEAAEGDLTRLDDLISEVESKVRSLGRQKRRAERHRELLDRRLALEVAIARFEIERLESATSTATLDRMRLAEEAQSLAATRSATELVLEERRLEATDLGHRRATMAASLDQLRTRLHERERTAVISEERRNHAEARLGQLAEESATLRVSAADADTQLAALAAERGRLARAVEDAGAAARARAEENVLAKNAVVAERAAAEAAAGVARGLAHQIAKGQGERASAERSGGEAWERHGQALEDLASVEHELARLTGQTELWETQADEIRREMDAARAAVEEARREVEVARGREARAKEELRRAEDRVSTLSGQVAAREALERAYEGFAPAVAAIMAARDEFPGVHGPLADYVQRSADPQSIRAIEAYLGPMLQALVVEDLATARAIRDWFRESWAAGGSLVLLPVGALPPDRTATSGKADGRGWVDLLLSDCLIVAGDPLADFVRGASRVGETGDAVDSRGIVRLSERAGDQGILARREALRRLNVEAAEAERERDARFRERDAIREALASAEDRHLAASESLRMVEGRLKHNEIDALARHSQHDRLRNERQRLLDELAGFTVASEESATRLQELDALLEKLSTDVEAAAGAESGARDRLNALQGEWDRTRDEEAEARVRLTNAEADFRDVDRRLRATEETRAATRSRLERIEAESGEFRHMIESLAGSRDDAAREIDDLFRLRDEETGALAVLDARLAEVDSELAELGERHRVARRREAEAIEGRHDLDLRIAELRSQHERLRERLETEWGRPWSTLIAEPSQAEGDPETWRSELRAVAGEIDSMGPVNMLAVEEHAEEDRRLTFLLGQRSDLVEARSNLATAIRQINRTAREAFQSTFDAVRVNFQRTFHSLFTGGECDIWLADPEDPLESAIDIQASPLGKRTQRIHLLSGGERTLTALALLFALYLVKPSPFCVLDEVDAPLDESNVDRFIRLLDEFKSETQFIVITHNPRTMEAADWVYGVTMEDPGVSTIVGVELVGRWAEVNVAG